MQNKYENLLIDHSSMRDGNMRLIDPLVDDEAKKNRERYFATLGINPLQVVSARLEHGNQVEVVGLPAGLTEPLFIPKCDALITGNRNVALSITAADCPAVYLYDPVKSVIALVHAGWKGLAAGVIPNTVNTMMNQFNCNPADLDVFIGPHAQYDSYEVGWEVYQKFYSGPGIDLREGDRKYKLSLASLIARKLLGLGVRLENITASPEDTVTEDDFGLLPVTKKYFSFRRERSNPLKTQLAIIMMQ